MKHAYIISTLLRMVLLTAAGCLALQRYCMAQCSNQMSMCARFLGATASYDPDSCLLTGLKVTHCSYGFCGGNPIGLWVLAFKDHPSNGNMMNQHVAAFMGCFTNNCGSSAPQNCNVSVTKHVSLSFPPGWQGSTVYLEGWWGQSNGAGGLTYCQPLATQTVELPPLRFIEGTQGGAGIYLSGYVSSTLEYSIGIDEAPPFVPGLLLRSRRMTCVTPFANNTMWALCEPTGLVATLVTDGDGHGRSGLFSLPPSLFGETIHFQWMYRNDSNAIEASNVGTLFAGCN